MLVSSTNAGLVLAVFLRTTLKETIMTNLFASIVVAFNAVMLQRSRAKALKIIKSTRANVRTCGARPEPGTAFAVGKGLVWGSSKYQAVDLSIRDCRAEDTDERKWAGTCTHA